MNSLNIIAKNIGVTPPPSPPSSRGSSPVDVGRLKEKVAEQDHASRSSLTNNDEAKDSATIAVKEEGLESHSRDSTESLEHEGGFPTEKTPLLNGSFSAADRSAKSDGWWLAPKRAAGAVVGTVRIIVTTILAPGRYVIACFYDEHGNFSTFMPIRRLSRKFRTRQRDTRVQSSGKPEKRSSRRTSQGISRSQPMRRSPSTASSASSVLTTDSEMDGERSNPESERDSPSHNTRSKALAMTSMHSDDGSSGGGAPRKSIRIKLNNEEALKQRRLQKRVSQSSGKKAGSSAEEISEEAAAALKSPTSPLAGATKATRYPRSHAPAGPLVPLRRQPSYSALPTIPFSDRPPHHQKTLILDLDETLIHSMSKGGRFTTGHMVEVKLQSPIGISGGSVLGPQVPILYYVHKRPYCDEFLRKVSKWFNLVVFTAAVQEYADPVIDWLELERKYFSARYYRQHCTFRNNAYIKDLSQVEPDLSRVIIVDNSPLSYAFHEDNAIPIEGWISDPTDNDLMNLVPLLEGLQYVPDVRALLMLRKGQPNVNV